MWKKGEIPTASFVATDNASELTGRMMPVPTTEEQVAFLQNVQRLLTDGLFVASYKFALLPALADLAVLKADASGDELSLDARDIAAVFVELYWRQTRPFRSPSAPEGVVLRQNTGQ